MTVFKSYAHYYDLLYQDKNYRAEVEYVHKLLQTHAPGTRTILELGCGTGAHATLLAEQNYTVFGVDASEEMLHQAKECMTGLSTDQREKVSFFQGDLRTFRTDLKFDAVISLFHVMSYQTKNEDLRKAFETAFAHLKPGGVFIFDCWYGPAVLRDLPVVRVKRFQNKETSIIRIAEPEIDVSRNLVSVNYHMLIKNSPSKTIDEVREVHRMRYLFEPEVDLLCSANGLNLIHSEEWLSGESPSLDSWYVCFVGCKK